MMSLRSEAAMGLNFIDAPAMEVADPDSSDDPTPATTPLPTVPPATASRPHAAPVAPPALFVATPAAPGASLGGASLPVEQRRVALQTLDDAEVKGCTKCRLSETRTQTVFGEGDPAAAIFFVGEGPGETEDQTGRPFVGRAGQLLDKMIAGMGLAREQVFIANVCKCRPPGNRVPAPDEAAACMPYLVRQIEVVRPKVIVTLGLTAAKYMLGDNKLAMGLIRGQWHAWRGVRLMPTFHPSYVLRTYTEATRKAVWEDLKAVMAEVGLAAPKSTKGG
jgi:uracil-DNA glycosylase family 4